MRHASVLLLVPVVVVICLVGCTPKQPTAPTSGPTTPPTTKTGTPEKHYEIAVVPKGTAHSFWLTVKAGAEAAGQEFGATIDWNGPSKETEVDRQKSIVEDFISQKVDAIVMAACNADALVPTVKQAIETGIPVVTIDSGISSDDAYSFVATDNVAGARKAGEKLLELIGGQGKVGLIPFKKGAQSSDQREQGFREAIKAVEPAVSIAAVLYSESDASGAMTAAEDMLTASPDLAGIFAANEPAGVGAAQVLKQRKLGGKVKLVAFDASEAEITALQEGTIQALVVQNPFKMGYDGVHTAIRVLNGEQVDKRIDTGVAVVTMDNLNDPEIHKLLYPLEGK